MIVKLNNSVNDYCGPDGTVFINILNILIIHAYAAGGNRFSNGRICNGTVTVVKP